MESYNYCKTVGGNTDFDQPYFEDDQMRIVMESEQTFLVVRKWAILCKKTYNQF